MKKHLLTATLLLTLLPLSACMTNERPEWLGGEAKRPVADVKMGARRPPVLNGQSTPPMPQPPRPMPSMMVPPPPPPPDNRVMNEEDTRKPFGVDPSYSTETVATAPVPPAPELKISPESKAAMAEQPKVVEEPSQPSWISRVGERLSGEPETPDVEKIKNQPYPKLSDVPEKPAEFGAVKTSQAEKMDEMKAELAAAQTQRESLAAEPSQAADGQQLLGHAYDAKLGPAGDTPKTAAVVSTMESPPGEVLPKKAEAPQPAAKPEAKKSAAKKTATKKAPAKKSKPAAKKPAAKAVEPEKTSEPVTSDAPKMSVPEQGLY